MANALTGTAGNADTLGPATATPTAEDRSAYARAAGLVAVVGVALAVAGAVLHQVA